MTDFKELSKQMTIKGIVISFRYRKERVKDLIEQTAWMPEDSSNSERLYCLLKDYKDIYCPICGKKKKFAKINHGYYCTCNSKKCIHEWKLISAKEASKRIDYKTVFKHYKETMLKRYGVEHNWSSEKLRENCYNTTKERYGVEHALQSKEFVEKRRDTLSNKYGTINCFELEKTKETMLKKYGVTNPMQSKELMQKQFDSMQNRYGHAHPYQIKEFFDKAQISGKMARKYKDTGLIYRGSYEKDFLDNYYGKIDIVEPPVFKYTFNGSERVYLPDFYIPSLNLIIEIKSSYYLKKYKKKCDEKAEAVKLAGFNFIMIIDKDYSQFNTLFQMPPNR